MGTSSPSTSQTPTTRAHGQHLPRECAQSPSNSAGNARVHYGTAGVDTSSRLIHSDRKHASGRVAGTVVSQTPSAIAVGYPKEDAHEDSRDCLRILFEAEQDVARVLLGRSIRNELLAARSFGAAHMKKLRGSTYQIWKKQEAAREAKDEPLKTKYDHVQSRVKSGASRTDMSLMYARTHNIRQEKPDISFELENLSYGWVRKFNLAGEQEVLNELLLSKQIEDKEMDRRRQRRAMRAAVHNAKRDRQRAEKENADRLREQQERRNAQYAQWTALKNERQEERMKAEQAKMLEREKRLAREILKKRQREQEFWEQHGRQEREKREKEKRIREEQVRAIRADRARDESRIINQIAREEKAQERKIVQTVASKWKPKKKQIPQTTPSTARRVLDPEETVATCSSTNTVSHGLEPQQKENKPKSSSNLAGERNTNTDNTKQIDRSPEPLDDKLEPPPDVSSSSPILKTPPPAAKVARKAPTAQNIIKPRNAKEGSITKQRQPTASSIHMELEPGAAGAPKLTPALVRSQSAVSISERPAPSTSTRRRRTSHKVKLRPVPQRPALSPSIEASQRLIDASQRDMVWVAPSVEKRKSFSPWALADPDDNVIKSMLKGSMEANDPVVDEIILDAMGSRLYRAAAESQ